jgi:hypothetical protein
LIPMTDHIDVLENRSQPGARPEEQPVCAASGGSKTLEMVRRRLLGVFPFQVVLAGVVVVVLFALVRGGVSDPDIWWHLRNAQNLVQHHQLPRFDTYSFTVAGHPWINHEWLSEVPYYLAWRAFGLVGIKSLSLILMIITFLGLLYLCTKASGNYKASVAACAFSTFLATINAGPRTILFGYVYLVALLIILERFRRTGRAPLWAIPPLFALWVNTHGSWLLGLIVLSITIAAGLVKGQWGSVEAERWNFEQFGKLALTWMASIVALFVNPYGWRLVFYPFDLAFRQKLNISHVAEWVSVDFHQVRGKIVLGLIVFLLVSALVRRRRWTLTELLLLLFGLYSGLTHVRFLFLLGVLAAPVIAKMLDFFPPYRQELETPIVNAVAVCCMVAGMIYFWPTARQLEHSVDKDYPAGAVEYLKTHPPQGPMLNAYLWGGYLGWNDNSLKVFIDSRVDIFEYEGVLQDYLDLLGVQRANAALDKYKIRYVLFPRDEILTYTLLHDPGWTVRYSDPMSVLFERAGNDALGAATSRTSR